MVSFWRERRHYKSLFYFPLILLWELPLKVANSRARSLTTTTGKKRRNEIFNRFQGGNKSREGAIDAICFNVHKMAMRFVVPHNNMHVNTSKIHA